MLFDGPSMEDKVKQWLMDSCIYKDMVIDETANFHFLAEYPERSGNLIDIINPKNRLDTLLLVTNVTIDPSHRTALAALPPTKRQEFVEDLMKTLIFQPVGFIATPDMNMPEKIQLVKDLYQDGLTKTGMMEALGWVNRSITFIVWKFKHNFGEGQPKEPPGTMYG